MSKQQPRSIPGVFKNVIAPIQFWLMSQGRCVGCGRDLDVGKSSATQNKGQKIVCDCGRVFIKDSKSQKYRRALLKEV